ncbi:DUF5317 domain-containing protein [Paenibacillus sp. FJAT-26967]|uniref:DUF5317 domain-containing protein n=1 Tax=Paenibacillus sp. FJAT-26967 TaxID=1729690 RepID=UPI0008395664|nr:DUF5317 domain-containing protein [Paenibacillus sp. FJAT-26967]
MITFILLAVILTVSLRRNPLTLIENVSFKWPYLLLGSFAAQLLIFFVTTQTNRTYPYLTEIAIGAAVLFLWLNRRIPGVAFIFIGALWNLTALVIHGGLMPVSESALQMAGLSGLPELEPRHQLMSTSSFGWMGDWIPFIRRVFSIGDLWIGAGIIWFLAGNSLKREKNEG